MFLCLSTTAHLPLIRSLQYFSISFQCIRVIVAIVYYLNAEEKLSYVASM